MSPAEIGFTVLLSLMIIAIGCLGYSLDTALTKNKIKDFQIQVLNDTIAVGQRQIDELNNRDKVLGQANLDRLYQSKDLLELVINSIEYYPGDIERKEDA